MIVGYVVDDEEDSVDEGADDDCFFFVVDRFLQTSTPVTFTNALRCPLQLRKVIVQLVSRRWDFWACSTP